MEQPGIRDAAVVFNSIDDLECHFSWLPERDTTKEDGLSDVIRKTEAKISREPYFKVALLTTLSYLYTRKGVTDFTKAKKSLNEAKQLTEEVKNNRDLAKTYLSSEFIVLADELHMKQMRTQLTGAERDKTLKRLSELWKDPSCRAHLLAVKGATFDCFGPMKYPVGARAFAQARGLEPNNYYWTFWEARLLGRVARQKRRVKASEYEISLWKTARTLGESQGLVSALFYSQFAEAIVYNKEHKLCENLLLISVDLLSKFSDEQKENFHLVYVINLKIFSELWRRADKSKKSFLEARRKSFFDDIKNVARVKKDPSFYLQLVNERDNNFTKSEILELLKVGKAIEPHHIWINLRLIEQEADECGKEMTVDKYDTLREINSVYKAMAAAVEFHKALYLLEQGDQDDAMRSCVRAFEEEQDLNEKIEFYKRCKFLNLLRSFQAGYEEYVAWFIRVGKLRNVPKFADLNEEDLLRVALQRDPTNWFAREQLGRYFLEKGEFTKASDCFRQLPERMECRRSLLSTALIRVPGCTLDTLCECLKLGCQDAANKILDTIESQADSDVTKMYRFRTAGYELCARIENLIESEMGFFVDPPEDVSNWSSQIRTRVEKFLRLRDEHCVKDKEMMSIRAARLKACKQFLKGDKFETYADTITQALLSSRNTLDTSVKRLSPRNLYYPFAFHGVTVTDTRDAKSLLKLHSSKQVISTLLANYSGTQVENKAELAKYLGTKLIFNANVDKDRLIELLSAKELRIIHEEGAWTVVFCDAMNDRKHNVTNCSAQEFCDEINKVLQRIAGDRGGRGPKTVYELMHFAAEFAEETLLQFLSCSSSGSGLLFPSDMQLDDAADMSSLGPRKWITDSVINAFIELKLQRAKKDSTWHLARAPITIELMDSPEAEGRLFPAGCDFNIFLVPMTVGENHMILLKLDVQEGQAQILDPLLTGAAASVRAASRLCELAHSRFGKEFKWSESECKKLPADVRYDSGLLVALFSQLLIDGKSLDLDDNRVKNGRKAIRKFLDSAKK